MRHRLTILIPFLILAAACDQLGIGGGGNESMNANASADAAARDKIVAGYDLPGGAFDRERFRTFSLSVCDDSFANAPVGPPQGVESLCACAAARLLAENDDNALRAMLRDDELGMSKQFAAQDQCMSAPAPAAGVAPPATGRARARANLAAYLSPDDYPAVALRNNEQGQVDFTLDIGPDGRVSACRIRRSSGSAALDSATCRIMRSRARYTPARDARGIAVADRADATIRWVLPSG